MSLRDFNWRKGLLRLWIFLSVLWVAIIATVFLYPARREYIEYQKRTVERAHADRLYEAKVANELKELKTLRALVNYALTEEHITKPEVNAGGQPVPPSHYKVYKAKESQTGVTVSFVWYLPTPPDLTDLDNVFKHGLGSGGLPATPREWKEQLQKPAEIIGLPPVGVMFDPFTGSQIEQGAKGTILSSSRGPKLSDNESTLASRLSKLAELQLSVLIAENLLLRAEKTLEATPGLSAREFSVWLVVVILIPVAILVLGFCLRWVLFGFSKQQGN
ncbi:MAG TPA: hypothetical protein VEF34_16180 [Syntrophobacteraceae bacterium]|nr:hypothetical protein [Syntrophobacteraceae bacterium]